MKRGDIITYEGKKWTIGYISGEKVQLTEYSEKGNVKDYITIPLDKIQNSAFERGRQRAMNAINNSASLLGITYTENGKKIDKSFTSENELNAFTKELDKKGIEWMAKYSSGWR
jgi:hypothetical protein